MGVYIEGLESPKTGSIRIQLYDDGTVWVFQGFGWERQENTYTDLDLVRCGECRHYEREECRFDPFWERATEPTDFCSYGERRADDSN